MSHNESNVEYFERRIQERSERRAKREALIAARQLEKEAREARKAEMTNAGARQERRIATRAKNKREIVRDNLRQLERELRATRLFNLALKKQAKPQSDHANALCETRRATSAAWREKQRQKRGACPVAAGNALTVAAEVRRDRKDAALSAREARRAREEAAYQQWRRDNPEAAAAQDAASAAHDAEIERMERERGL